jgi:hypothetical protein
MDNSIALTEAPWAKLVDVLRRFGYQITSEFDQVRLIKDSESKLCILFYDDLLTDREHQRAQAKLEKLLKKNEETIAKLIPGTVPFDLTVGRKWATMDFIKDDQ